MARLMGLDFGSKTVGVALSDPMGIIASPLETIFREKENKLRPTLRRISQLVSEQEVGLIVLGNPINMDDSIGERAVKTAGFKEKLEQRLSAEGLNVPVVLWDERLSTVGADEVLQEAEVAASERKRYIDKIAAALILEDFINDTRASKSNAFEPVQKDN